MATVWLKARTATIVVNSVTYDHLDFSYSENYSKFDATPITGATNAASALADQHGIDTVNTTCKGSFIVDSASIKVLLGGRSYTISYTGADGTAHSGSFTILTREKMTATKGAWKVSYTAEASDVVSNQ